MTEQNNKLEHENREAGKETIQGQDNTYTPEDIKKGKTMAGLAYVLFFLPLIACP